MRYSELIEGKLKGSYVGLNFSDQTNKNLFDYCQSLGIKNHLVTFHSTLLNTTKTINDLPTDIYPIVIQPNQVQYTNIDQKHLGFIPMIKFWNATIKKRYAELANSYGSLVKLRLHVSLAYGCPEPITFNKKIDFPLEIIGEYVDIRQRPGDARKNMTTV